MAVEIEAKMQVDSLAVIQDRLTKLGAQPLGEVLEVNTFFDTDDRSLLAADKGLRLRTNTPLPAGQPTHSLTFKGPRQHGPLKSREEKEVGVDNAKSATALLDALGFHPTLSFEKKRQSWKLDDCQVELDELPYLGVFVEIEGPREESVMKVRESLELSDEPIVKASYVALLTTHLQEVGISTRVVTFPK